MLDKGMVFKAAELGIRDDRPEKDFILAIFERALCDATGDDRNVKREARTWLFSNSSKRHTAIWWAEQIDAEHILKQIRRVVNNGTYKKNKGIGWLKKGKFFGY